MDLLKKYLIDSEDLNVVVIDAKELVSTSMIRTGAWPPAMIHLGQALMGQLLLTAVLTKETEGKISLQWSTQSPFGELFVEGQPNGKIRGTIMNPQAPVQNLYAGLGPGQLQVRKSFLESSTGIISARGDVCQDLLHYLEQSEQRQCAMNLWVDLKWNDNEADNPVEVNHAFGFLLEMLPSQNASKDQLRAMTWESKLKELGSLSEWEFPDGADSLDFMAKKIADGAGIKEILTQKVFFHCPCSEERAERALTLAVQQTGEPREESETIRCEFCGKTYQI